MSRRQFLSGVFWIAFFSLPLWWFFYSNPFFPSEITSLRKFEACCTAFPDHLVDHFPAAKPNADADAVFSYFPGYLQGGAHIQLRIRVSEKIAQELDERLRGETQHNYSGGRKFTHFNADQENALPTAGYHTRRDDRDAFEFPDHFTLHVLHADTKHGWNHGETRGTAVSLNTNEVIYWAENW